MIAFREAFPDLSFAGTADLIAEGDFVVGRWERRRTCTRPSAFSDFLAGALPAGSGRRMRFSGSDRACGSRTVRSRKRLAWTMV